MLNASPTIDTSLTQQIGIRGWSHLDAVLLASLATGSPLLLIGPHGTAKSQLIERMSRALGLSFRHYNASLLNYDDLVGIPMPNLDGTAVDFIKSPGTIWGAQFVFLDEISRCRADLQNKLFPIIHERRVVGIQLEELIHRWAAMNPPAPEELNTANATGNYYLGSEPLDPALTDRFPFIIPVPTWAEITREDRRKLVSWTSLEDPFNVDSPPDFAGLVEATQSLIQEVEAAFSEWLGDYVVYLVDLLEQSGLPQSPRRARMIARNVAAIHAARLVLEGEDADPELSAEAAVLYGMPQSATDTPPSQVKVVAVHKQAWEIAQHMDDETWRQVIEETNTARRVVLADELGFDDENMSRLVTQTLSTEDSDVRQMALAVGMYYRFHQTRNLDPSAFEPLAQLVYHITEPRIMPYTVHINTPQMNLWQEIQGWMNNQMQRADSPLFRLQRNFLLYGFPDWWQKEDWKSALQVFTTDLMIFGITDDMNDGDDQSDNEG